MGYRVDTASLTVPFRVDIKPDAFRKLRHKFELKHTLGSLCSDLKFASLLLSLSSISIISSFLNLMLVSVVIN